MFDIRKEQVCGELMEVFDRDELGQEVKAIVVPAGGSNPTIAELTGWAAATLAAYKVPSVWELRAEPLPRNASGKVIKFVLGAGS